VPHRTLDLHTVPGLWPLTWPMGLTMLRLLLLPVFLWLVLQDASAPPGERPMRWWAIGVFALMAATDKLDGYLARKLNQASRLGTILDPVADKLLVACSVVLLSVRAVATPEYEVPLAVVLCIYGGYVVVALGTLALLVLAGRVRINPSPLGKFNTGLQLGLVLLTLLAPQLHAQWGGWLRPSLRWLWWTAAALAAATALDYVRRGIQQFREAGALPPGEQ
jgi:cardiolipin synthase (CMP-forming)